MGSHRVTCHPTEAASPALTPADRIGIVAFVPFVSVMHCNLFGGNSDLFLLQ